MDAETVALFSRKLELKLGVTTGFSYCYPFYIGKYYPYYNKIELDWELLNQGSNLCHFFFHEAAHSTSHWNSLNRLIVGLPNYNENAEEYIAEFTALLLSRKFKNQLSKSRKKERLSELKVWKSNLSPEQVKYCKIEIKKAYSLLESIFS